MPNEETEQEKLIREQRETIEKLSQEKAGLEGSVKTFEKTVELIKGGQPNNTQTATPQWTEEQWQKFEEETGTTRTQLKMWDGLTSAQIEKVKSGVMEEIKKYDELIKAQQNKIDSFEKSKTMDKIKREFYKSRPELERYQKDIDDFMGDYPDEVKNDPEKYAKLITKAETYVKGMIAAKGGKVPKFNKSIDDDESEDIEERLTGLREYEKNVMRRIIPPKEKNDILKQYEHPLMGDKGIQISERERFETATKAMKEHK